ncbi:MAG: DUF3289 family protein [Sphingobacteriia bacterium]|nr:DUF3289 family protein [Sphingobacteriia bacterium]
MLKSPAAKAEIISYKYCANTKQFIARIRYTLHDDFGLDVGDVLRQNSLVRGYFKSWYILQHYYCYHPFLTEVIIERDVSGKIN